MSGYTLEICTAVNATASVYLEHKSHWLWFWSGGGSVFLSDDWRSAETQVATESRWVKKSPRVLKWIYCLFLLCFFVFLQLVLMEERKICVFLETTDVSFSKLFSFYITTDQQDDWKGLIVFYTFHLRPIFFFTHCKLWHDWLMYSTHQRHNMGIDQLESYGDDVLV